MIRRRIARTPQADPSESPDAAPARGPKLAYQAGSTKKGRWRRRGLLTCALCAIALPWAWVVGRLIFAAIWAEVFGNPLDGPPVFNYGDGSLTPVADVVCRVVIALPSLVALVPGVWAAVWPGGRSDRIFALVGLTGAVAWLVTIWLSYEGVPEFLRGGPPRFRL